MDVLIPVYRTRHILPASKKLLFRAAYELQILTLSGWQVNLLVQKSRLLVQCWFIF